jgi:hypothetical protein
MHAHFPQPSHPTPPRPSYHGDPGLLTANVVGGAVLVVFVAGLALIVLGLL